MLRHRYRRATLHRVESGPPQSGHPKGDDGGAIWSENRLEHDDITMIRSRLRCQSAALLFAAAA
jgi:hypothetical protein